MTLKESSTYLKRPIESFERDQKRNFKTIFGIVKSKQDKEKDYDCGTIGFLSPHEDNHTKELIESQYEAYKLFLLFDLPMRKTNQVLECLIPKELASKYDAETKYNLCIDFKRFKKVIFTYRSTLGTTSKWPIVLIDDFEVISPIELRNISSRDSDNALRLRDEILFGELDINVPSYVKMSILNSLFLSPKIKYRSGIETKSLIGDSKAGRFLINLDNYNKMIKKLIPPEISNCHSQKYRGSLVPHRIDSIGETLNISINFPISKYYFNSVCTPSQKEEVNVDLRNFSGTELGINHQTKFMAYDSRKDLIDKFVVTEFFYKQDWLPGFSIKGMRKSLKLIRENKEFLYGDYVARLFKPVSISPLSVSERQRIRQLAENYCGEVGYEIKQGKNPYLNSIMNSIGGNLHRVKAILGRSSFKTNRNVESLYLQNLELNFEEIKDSKDYINLPDKKANMEKIRRIMNNVVRRNIITSLRERGRSAYEEEIINAVSVLCHDKKDILNEIYNLMRGGVIYKVNNILYLIDGDL